MDSHHHHHHHFPLKKPKLEDPIADEPITGEKPVQQQEDGTPLSTEDHEEALLALIAHRTREVEHSKQRVAYYITQLEASERRLRESQTLLVRLRSQRSAAGAAASSPSPPQQPPPPRPQLIIPAVKPKNLTPLDPPPRPKASSTVLDKRKQETISRVSLPQCNEKKRATRMLVRYSNEPLSFHHHFGHEGGMDNNVTFSLHQALPVFQGQNKERMDNITRASPPILRALVTDIKLETTDQKNLKKPAFIFGDSVDIDVEIMHDGNYKMLRKVDDRFLFLPNMERMYPLSYF